MMNIHSSWRNDDIAELIPELSEALADPSHIDAEILQAKLNIVLGNQVNGIQAIIASDDFQQLGHTPDPHAMARVLRKLEISMLDMKRVVTFSQLAPQHYNGQEAELQGPMTAIMQQLQSVAVFLNQSFSQVITCLAQLDDAQLRDMMASSEELREFAPLIKKCRKAPNPSPELEAQIDVNEFAHSLKQFEASNDYKLSEEERKQAFAEGLTGVVRFRRRQAEASGFKDTMAQFAFANEAPQDLIDNLAASSQKHIGTIVSDFTEIQKLAKDKLPEGKQWYNYSWEETKDIVCAAYTKLDPELGKLARRAFDEGWLLAKEYGVPNPHTLPGLPISHSPNSHPFAAMSFDGSAIDVIFVGHELAHVLSNYIAGQKHGVFSHDAPLIVQESFSHFGEALLEDEMVSRAENDEQRAWIKTMFLAKEFEALTIIGFAKFEEELYKLVEKSGEASPSFDAINDLFKQYNVEFQQLTGEELDVRKMQGLWHILMQPPHTAGVYPVTKIMAAALHDECERNPKQFRARYHAMMEAGGTVGVEELWRSLLGNNIAEQKKFIEARLAKLADKTAAIKDEIANMPAIGVAEDSDSKARPPTIPNGDARDLPVIGAFTEAFTKRMAESEHRGRV